MTQEQRLSVIKSMVIEWQTEVIKKYDEVFQYNEGSPAYIDTMNIICEYKEQVEPLLQFLKLQEKQKN